MRIEFRDTRETLRLLDKLNEPPLDNLPLDERGKLEDLLKKACVFRFIAEFEYYFIDLISNKNLESEVRKGIRKHIIKELYYKNIKKIFRNNFWRDVERKTLENIKTQKDEYRNFNPQNDAPFNNFVDIRNELAHSLDTGELIDINTLKKTIDYMEELLNVLKERL